MVAATAATMDAEEYLDRYGVTAYMKDVVTLLLENRPSSPIAFMAKYFRTVTQGSSPLLRAYRYIRLANPSQDAFVDNLVSAYVALDARRGVSGVTGAELLRLLRLLCAECPIDVTRSLLLLIDRTESDPVCFEEFSSAVRAGLLYDELFQRASSLFAMCDPDGTGNVPRSVLDLAVRQVAGAVRLGLRWLILISQPSTPFGPTLAQVSGSELGAATAAARAEHQRLQRDVQCEVVHRLSSSAGTSASASGTAGDGGAQASALVGHDEFLKACFSASIAGQLAGAAALETAANYKPAPVPSRGVGSASSKWRGALDS